MYMMNQNVVIQKHSETAERQALHKKMVLIDLWQFQMATRIRMYFLVQVMTLYNLHRLWRRSYFS